MIKTFMLDPNMSFFFFSFLQLVCNVWYYTNICINILFNDLFFWGGGSEH